MTLEFKQGQDKQLKKEVHDTIVCTPFKTLSRGFGGINPGRMDCSSVIKELLD